MSDQPNPITIVTERSLAETGLCQALRRAFDVRSVYVDEVPPSQMSNLIGRQQNEVTVWVVHQALLMAMPEPLDWGGYSGRRILYDQDASNAVMSVGFSPPKDQWIPTFRRHGFDLLLCAGRELSHSLNDLGVPSVWWPKAYDPSFFHNLNLERHGYSHFGTLYVARQAMLHRLKREGIPVRHFRAPPGDLNQILNRHLGLMVCTLTNWTRGRLSRVLRKLNPEWGLKLSGGPEPMLKLFEGAAAGCAVFNDYLDELADLGFVDGETVITWRDFDDLVDKARYYLDREDQLAEIGKRASELCLERHTWDHRMEELRAILAK